MRLLPTRRLVAGAVLAADVFQGGADGTPLLRTGTNLSPDYTKRLLDAGINAVWVEDSVSVGIRATPLIDEGSRAKATKGIREAMSSVKDGKQGAQVTDEQIARLHGVTMRIAEQLQFSSEAGVALGDLSSADGYAYRHAVNTTALGLLIGERLIRQYGYLDWEKKLRYNNVDIRLLKLGLGLLLHDVGMLSVPESIIYKKGPLTKDEMDVMRQHPDVGARMFNSWAVSPLVQAVIRRHHERWDGSGYPVGLEGENIHQLGRIAAVVDVYHAMISNRPHAPARPPEEAYKTICDGAGKSFDPLVVQVFCAHVPPYPTGTEVELNDGSRALVAGFDGKGNLTMPRLRLIETVGGEDRPGEEFELKNHPDLTIVRSILVDPPPEPPRSHPRESAAEPEDGSEPEGDPAPRGADPVPA